MQSYEKLKLADVEQLAGYAMQMGYYANAIELSRELFDVLPNYEIRHEEEVDLPKRIEQLKYLELATLIRKGEHSSNLERFQKQTFT